MTKWITSEFPRLRITGVGQFANGVFRSDDPVVIARMASWVGRYGIEETDDDPTPLPVDPWPQYTLEADLLDGSGRLKDARLPTRLSDAELRAASVAAVLDSPEVEAAFVSAAETASFARVLTLNPGDAIPPGTSAATIIARRLGRSPIFLDLFDRADGVVGNDWTADAGWALALQRLAVAGVHSGVNAWAPGATTTTADYVEIIASGSGSGSAPGAPYLVLGSTARSPTFDGYAGRWNGSSTGSYQFYKVVGGVFTLLGSIADVGSPVKDLDYKYRFERDGGDLRFYRDDVLRFSFTDPTPLTAGNIAGVRHPSASTTGTYVKVDRFEFGHLVTA